MKALILALALIAALGFLAGRQHVEPVKGASKLPTNSPRATPSAASRSLVRLSLPQPWSTGLTLSPQGATPAATPSAVSLSRSATAAVPTSPSAPPWRSVTVPPVVSAKAGEARQAGPKTYARSKVSAAQWPCLEALWQRESGWQPDADNPSSTAFGIAQMVTETSADPRAQIDDGLTYIRSRYGSACGAWAFWRKNRWY